LILQVTRDKIRNTIETRLRDRLRTFAFRFFPVLVLLLSALPVESGKDSVPPPSPNPAIPWTPPPNLPAGTLPPETSKTEGLPETAGKTLTLAEILDIALRNNPDTRAAWFEARSAWENFRSKKSDYYPSANLTANLTHVKQSAVGGEFIFKQTTYGPALSLSYLLLDFGTRRGQLESAEQDYIASSLNQNSVIQNVILQVEQAYISYLKEKALLAAAEVSLKDAREHFNAAEERHRAGVATIADVLQAKTAVSQAVLAQQTSQGQIQSLRGGLATTMGLPATTDIDVGTLPEEIPSLEYEGNVDRLLEEAVKKRPDLAAARARALGAEKEVKKVRGDGLPTVSLTSNLTRIYYPDRDNTHTNNYSFGLVFDYPLFTGLQNHYNLLKAKADAETARAQADSLSNQVILEVWVSYYGLKTARQKIQTSSDLLDSAQESEKVALERYKAGVGSILDLLAAQSALADARAQEISSRTDWFFSLAQLSHDIGALGLPAPGERSP
jgi:outer membrane protein